MYAIMYTFFEFVKKIEKWIKSSGIPNKHTVHIIIVNNCNLPKKYRIIVLYVNNYIYKRVGFNIINRVIHNIHRWLKKQKVCYKRVT